MCVSNCVCVCFVFAGQHGQGVASVAGASLFWRRHLCARLAGLAVRHAPQARAAGQQLYRARLHGAALRLLEPRLRLPGAKYTKKTKKITPLYHVAAAVLSVVSCV